jgi:hypothetical protein
MSQIFKRGAVYQIRYYRNGQRIEESTSKTRYDEARDLLKKREGAIADGVPITAKSTRLTFDDAVKDVVSDYTINGKKSGRLRAARHIASNASFRRATGLHLFIESVQDEFPRFEEPVDFVFRVRRRAKGVQDGHQPALRVFH